MKHFEVETDNLEGISWSPNGTAFAVWESPLEVRLYKYRFHFIIKYYLKNVFFF